MSVVLEMVKGWTVGQLAALVYKMGDENARRILSCRKVVVTFEDTNQTAAITATSLILDCSKPFDPVAFIGEGWKELEGDERALALKQVDFSTCQFLTCLKEGDGYIKGEEKLRRLKEDYPQLIRHGGNQFLALWEDYMKNGNNSVLEHLRRTQDITYLDFFGLILQRPYGPRLILSLYWDGGHWCCHYRWLTNELGDREWSSVSPVS
ncbi:MAG: hypothetical protein A3E37_00240 [Candidatus Andersenbacteria bacterium RIFCSPHIGHO2_12_FULL_46_9]|nr:MAG: hypothetical protein UW94_C0001G0077 [Parcubacteria group bacterium GW2011_GWA2_45_14]OGY35775.1 MAG: hypothetical protein A3B76_03625 [Candidatus Andersenbacteria bacterium RIFCSPHIGHO2_02_FULL_46_16]OGY37815.1 MAG: hypothetical protein A3E37_00240 [Candidatus Andersenbacteria bacterium RIFCSPHIGHO2_12_FULL_46_9]HBE90479.1 hypothetical protein [Candidatus Andersenbacteria bacterium]